MSIQPSLRIVHCFRSPVGGLFRHVRDLVEAQAASGHKVGIVCDSSTGGDYEERLFDSLKPKLALGLARVEMQRHVGIGDIIAAWHTFDALKMLKPDVIHGHGAKGGVYARVFGTFMRGPMGKTARLYSAHGGSLHYGADSLTGKIFFALEKMLQLMTDRLLFVADYEHRTYEGKIGTIRVPFEIVYNGVDDCEFEPVMLAKNAADFLYIGMMRGLKGPDIFLDALARAKQKTGRKLTAVMVGDGDDLPTYKAQAAQLGFGSDVIFSDPMSARKAFELARIVVVPSRAEAMPYIVLEALAAGKPLIATSVGGIPEIFGDKKTGITEPEIALIQSHMIEALDDEAGWAAQMPDQARLKALFGVNMMTTRIEQAYFAALSHRNQQTDISQV
jgi:glycosyltransferase involved in cell wall biosynthesis